MKKLIFILSVSVGVLLIVTAVVFWGKIHLSVSRQDSEAAQSGTFRQIDIYDVDMHSGTVQLLVPEVGADINVIRPDNDARWRSVPSNATPVTAALVHHIFRLGASYSLPMLRMGDRTAYLVVKKVDTRTVRIGIITYIPSTVFQSNFTPVKTAYAQYGDLFSPPPPSPFAPLDLDACAPSDAACVSTLGIWDRQYETQKIFGPPENPGGGTIGLPPGPLPGPPEDNSLVMISHIDTDDSPVIKDPADWLKAVLKFRRGLNQSGLRVRPSVTLPPHPAVHLALRYSIDF